jgi:hypothetical protein
MPHTLFPSGIQKGKSAVKYQVSGEDHLVKEVLSFGLPCVSMQCELWLHLVETIQESHCDSYLARRVSGIALHHSAVTVTGHSISSLTRYTSVIPVDDFACHGVTFSPAWRLLMKLEIVRYL